MTWTAKQKKEQSKKLKAAWERRKATKAQHDEPYPYETADEMEAHFNALVTPASFPGIGALLDQAQPDMVNHPPHYEQGPVECIDYIEGILTPQEYVGYLRGCMIKYQHRLVHKGSASENAEKINWYGARLAAKLKELENAN